MPKKLYERGPAAKALDDASVNEYAKSTMTESARDSPRRLLGSSNEKLRAAITQEMKKETAVRAQAKEKAAAARKPGS